MQSVLQYDYLNREKTGGGIICGRRLYQRPVSITTVTDKDTVF
ncbi:MAG: hypothetical protein P1P65_02985 [Treponema sp.]